MKVKLHILFFLICFASQINAQSYIEFVENKGQWDSNILYNGQINNGQIAFTQNGYKIVQYDAQQLNNFEAEEHLKGTAKSLLINGHSWEVSFLNSKIKPEIITAKKTEGYLNYLIGNDQSKWGRDCKAFTSLTYNDIYPNVDVNYYSSNGSLKYDLIVKPGGEVKDIKLAYKGVNKLTLNTKTGNLQIQTSIGIFEEFAPYTYQLIDNKKQKINSSYQLEGSTLSFKVKSYDKNLPLVIDPTLIFSTHTGSTADNWGFSATYGPDESFFGGGIGRTQPGFPVTPGAFQTNFGGVDDVSIIKLNPNGSTRIYATYIGGSADEQPHSLIADASGNLVIAGRTSSNNYPTTSLFGTRGGYDIFITKLNAAGNGLIGSMIIAGSNDDGVNINATRLKSSLQYNYGDDGRSEVNIDASGNIILASCTKSTNFFRTPFAFQNNYGGGGQDGVIIKATPNLSTLVFSSFFGGSLNDAAYVINTNPIDGNIYVAGGTESNNLLGDKTGVVSPSTNGGTDGFITIIKPDGTSIIKTTYLGTSSYDQIYGLQFDKFGFPYVVGLSLGNMPVINAAFSQAGSHQFITKLNRDLSNIEYSTKFGTNSILPNISPVAFLVDKCQNVYVSGWGGWVYENAPFDNTTTTGLSVTPDALKSATDGRDFYYFVLERNATSQLFGSFFGGNQAISQVSEHVDGGTSRFDPKGYIYQAACASCQLANSQGSAQYPTTAGSFSQSNGAGATGCNLGMTKIRFNLTGVGADLKATDTSGCVPLKVDFSDVFLNAVRYEFYFKDGSPVVSTTSPNVTHTFNTAGYYRVMMIAIDSLSCNLRDTAYINIRVRNDRATVDYVGLKQPPCLNLSYIFTNTSVAPAAKPFGTASFVWDFGDGSPLITTGNAPQPKTYAAPGNYTVKLLLKDTNYCNSPDTAIKIFRLSTTVKADFTYNNGCAPYNATFNNTSLAGATFEWQFGDGGTSTAITPTHIYSAPGTYTVTLIANDPNTCNFTDTTRKSITINPTPVANFTFSPNPSLINTPTQFTNLSVDANKYVWKFGDGDSSTLTNPLYQYNASGTFNVCLTASNQFGCTDTTCYSVLARIEPALDIANAFTPNGDGVNDKVFVRGFGIKTINWRIFNRWGQIVFETNQRNVGWNGIYKGKLQPMDAYAYTLLVELSDGQKVKKSGDITLIR